MNLIGLIVLHTSQRNINPMDYIQAKSLSQIADKQVILAEEYESARRKSGKAESELKLILASKLAELRGKKKNIGIEMAILMLLEDDKIARGLYKEFTEQEAIYKGLEKLLDAYASKLITEQAIMKFIKTGEKWG